MIPKQQQKSKQQLHKWSCIKALRGDLCQNENSGHSLEKKNINNKAAINHVPTTNKEQLSMAAKHKFQLASVRKEIDFNKEKYLSLIKMCKAGNLC